MIHRNQGNPGAGAAPGKEGGPSPEREITRELPIDYKIIEPIIIRKNRIVVEMEDELLEEYLETYVVDPKTKRTPQFGHLYQWGIDVVPHIDITERGERVWISKSELRKLEGLVLRFILEGDSFGHKYVDEATYKIVNGELVPAPEYLA